MIKKLLFLICLVLHFTAGDAITIILTSDQQLNDLLDPDKKIDLSTGYSKRYASLRDICLQAKKNDDHILTIAFDEFFRQYRDQAGTERLLTPDSDEYVQKIKVIGDFAKKYGLEMGLSLLSPLELGPAFKKQTGKTGQWVHFKVANRDPATGKFNVKLWQQLYWTNNKGRFSIKLKDVKAYAFNEKKIPDQPFKVVCREDIVPLNDVDYDQWEIPVPADDSDMDTDLWSSTSGSGQNIDRARRIEVFSDGTEEKKGYDRVLVILEYEVPEMAYFAPEAAPFLENLLKKYHQNGVDLRHFYSDELHLQQDWVYFGHHDNGQFAVRYFTQSLGKSYEKKFGVPFEEKDLLYFVYGPDIHSNSVYASRNVQYVMGESNEEIHRTFLFRDNYYHMLNEHVVDLFKNAKKYASELFGVEDWGTHGHSSWAESPTVDMWDTRGLERHAYKYEYTPGFIWGNTVQQASAACYDYFKWGEYLQPTRNDFAELGWNDRNYYGAAMAASLGVLNKYPNAYPAFWGMPDAVKIRKAAINDAFGGAPRSRSIDIVTGHVHRDVNVLVLYPMNLVAVEERFGSWLTQYGYCNFISSEKLLELGSVNDEGEIVLKNKKYTTLVTLFEPLPNKGILDIMKSLVDKGGNVVWFGPPPLINASGEACLEKWEQLFGVEYNPSSPLGRIAPGMRIDFAGSMQEIPSQYILTDFSLDHIYPVNAVGNTSKVAYCEKNILVGTQNQNAFFFGFRPRDDQSESLGYETRTLFEILNYAGAYKPTGSFPDVNDNTEYLSRNTDYLMTSFPNGATVITRHYKTHKETWPGGFSRDPEEDARVLQMNPLPPSDILLKELKVNGHNLNYQGDLTMAFRMNEAKELIAFHGKDCKELLIDGETFRFAEKNLKTLTFAPSLKNPEREINIFIVGEGMVSIPLTEKISQRKLRLSGFHKKNIKFKLEKNEIRLNVDAELSGKWLALRW